jgi:hypothetical protein
MLRTRNPQVRLILTLAGAVLLLSGLLTFAGAEEPEFTGAGKCKMCHDKEKSGAQFTIWAAGPHAKAYETLASDESKAIAAEMGLGDPQQEDACLKCHVTAHGVAEERLGRKYSIEEGVSCESCHGAGSEYDSIKIKKQIMTGEVDGATVGLIEPTAEMCMGCHNEESPTYKPFDFEAAVAEIAHPIPAAHLEQYK